MFPISGRDSMMGARFKYGMSYYIGPLSANYKHKWQWLATKSFCKIRIPAVDCLVIVETTVSTTNRFWVWGHHRSYLPNRTYHELCSIDIFGSRLGSTAATGR